MSSLTLPWQHTHVTPDTFWKGNLIGFVTYQKALQLGSLAEWYLAVSVSFSKNVSGILTEYLLYYNNNNIVKLLLFPQLFAWNWKPLRME